MNLSEVAGRYHFCREDVFVVGKCVLGCGSCTSILLSIGLDFGEWGSNKQQLESGHSGETERRDSFLGEEAGEKG